MRHLTSTIALALSSAALTPPARALGDIKHVIEPGSGSTPYRRTLSGDFDADGNPDVLYQRGNSWDAILGPALYEARQSAIASPIDCDVLRHAEGDRWITLETTGLRERRMAYDVAGAPRWTWTSNVVGGTAWAGASRVRIWSDDGLEHFVVGLNGNTVVISKCLLAEDGSSLESPWPSLPSFVLAQTEPVVGIALFDRNGDGTPELAVRRATRLDIYSITTGARVAFHIEGAGWTANCEAVVRHQGLAQQWLAIISNSTTNPGVQRSAVVGLDGVRSLQLMTNYDVGAITAARHDSDGLDDLVISCTTHYNLHVVANTGGAPDASGYAGPSFVPTSASTVFCPVSPYALPNQATPLAHDFDLDGDIDLGLPVLGASMLWVDRQVLASHFQLAPVLLNSEFSNGTATAEVGVSVPGSTRKLYFEVSVPAPGAGGWWPSSPNTHHLEITAWSHIASNPHADPIPFDIERVQLPAQASAPLLIPEPAGLSEVPGATVTCAVPADCADAPGGVGFDRVVYLRVQVVRLRAGRYSAVSPGTMYAFHAKEQRSNFEDDEHPTDNGALVEHLLDMMPEGSQRFIVTSPLQPSGGARPPTFGKRVGMGGHVPCIIAPLGESPVGGTN